MASLTQVLRRLTTRPGLTAASIVMLALALGLATAMFAAVDALLARPVPFPEPEALAYVGIGDAHGASFTVSPAILAAWRDRGGFATLASAAPDTALVTGTGDGLQPRRMAWVTPDLFALLGDVRPLAGRVFLPGEGRAGADDRVLLSETLWRAAFGADPGIVGRRIVVGDDRVEVVGILPASFRFPAWDTALWRPIDFSAPPAARAHDRAWPIARFGARPPADALALATRLARETDAALVDKTAVVRPLVDVEAYDRRAVPLLAGAVGLVFVVLCLNVAALRAVQLGQRRRDFGVSLALGASRARLLAEAAYDGVLIGAAGIAGGVVLGAALLRVARANLPPSLVPSLNPLEVDLRSLAVMGALGLLVTLATALWPAWRASRVDPLEAMGAVARTATAPRRTRLAARAILVAEMALACVLLITAGLLVRTFLNLSHADRGLDTGGVLTAAVVLPAEGFANKEARIAAVAAMDATVRALPGVRALTWSSGVPPAAGSIAFDVKGDAGSGAVASVVDLYAVSPGFFELYGVPLTRGRGFTPADGDHAAIVGERLARQLWPGLDPIGRTLSWASLSLQVVGVVREVQFPTVTASRDRPEFYQPYRSPGRYVTLSLRCGTACPSLGALRERLLAASPGATVWKADRLDDIYLAELARPRAVAAAGAGFAGIAAAAAIAGLFCVLTFAVAERRRELGIRTALGATPARLGRLVLTEAIGIAAVGLALGAVAAISLGRAAASLTYGVTTGDPLTWTAVIGSLALLALAAGIRPAREAMRVDPVQLLRHE